MRITKAMARRAVKAVKESKEMKERPILFNSEMIKAVLDGRKTQTRRVIKPQPLVGIGQREIRPLPNGGRESVVYKLPHCPYGKPGDQLWVRETHQFISPDETWRDISECKIIYKATDTHPGFDGSDYAEHKGLSPNSPIWDAGEVHPWRPSIFLPRKYSRIQLEIVSVKIERVQEILYDDAVAEGMSKEWDGSHYWYSLESVEEASQHPPKVFRQLWDSINSKRGFSWDSNPFVWVVEFNVVS